MSLIQRVTGSKIFRILTIGLLGGLPIVTVLGGFILLSYYSMFMPRSPQPEIGRIYRMRGPQYGNWVYVNEKELGRWNFIENDMGPVSVACAVILLVVGKRAGWFTKSRR
ncbi:MAG: hypothetical protein DMG36_14415 [Acidobacteria bacterium]|nr:MAG: hypothetical protein DMG36_14415 [Acidobacteriota bacterium]